MDAKVIRPDWSYWLGLRKVKIGDAVALTLGFDPKSIEKQSVLNPQEFSAKQHKAEYEKRLRIAISHLGDEEFFRSQGMTSRRNPIRSRPIFLVDFVKLAAHYRWQLPAALKALAERTKAGEQSEPMPDGAQGVGDGKTATAAVKKLLSPICEVFRKMQKLCARELNIAFVAGESGTVILEISARNTTKRVALAEVDLFDRRKATLNEQGTVLLGMAKARGIQTADQKTARRISRLRGALKEHIGLIDNPIATFRKGVGYEPHFGVTDKRGAADQRAKRDSERSKVSLDELAECGLQAADPAQDDYPFEDEKDEAAIFLRGNRVD